MELEATVGTLKEELANSSGPSRRRAKGDKDPSKAIPRGPAVRELKGHRAPVTAVAIHPTYNLVVSCGEDATVRLWDSETGEFERSLKGHTNVVQDVAFHPNGSLLGMYILFLFYYFIFLFYLFIYLFLFLFFHLFLFFLKQHVQQIYQLNFGILIQRLNV